jgi:elongation factor 3
MLTGETIPTAGLLWKHPNLRIAYVAQHAFHHIEQHLDQTPSEYIQWRYSSGEDKESFEKATRQLTEEEEKKMAQKIAIEGSKYTVEQVLNRRKLKGTYEYEVSFVGQPADKNVWWQRPQLEALGFGKMVDAVDAREAAAQGAFQTPLTATHIAKHLNDVGLEPEFTLHSRMRGLSGGQKVKVVIGAAMWHHPHLLVLDEPSNYLDRDSLGALAGAIKDFGGGVVIISHNAEFVSHICSETWQVNDGKCVVSGETWNVAKEKIVAAQLAEEVTDAAGNVIKVKKAKAKRSARELKKALKDRKDKLAKGEDVSTDEELDAILDKE